VKAKLEVSGNRIEYQRGELAEWYVNDAHGLEQGFTLARRPGIRRRSEQLMIALNVSGDLHAERSIQGDSILLRSSKGAILRYSSLRAWDSRGRLLSSMLQLDHRELRLVVEDKIAQYPIVVDPIWTQQTELIASDAVIGDAFGASISVSGNTAVIGAPGKTFGANQGQGAAYMFLQSNGIWSMQQELYDPDGAGGDGFGSSVTVSGDTAVIGAPGVVYQSSSPGSAHVFVRSGTMWSLQQKLTGTASSNFGSSVALSGDTMVVGAPDDMIGPNRGQGSAHVFVRSGPTWTQQQLLTVPDGVGGDIFGSSVAVSGDTVVAGAPAKTIGANQGQGVAYVFVRTGTTWTLQQELSASDAAANDQFGFSVCVDGDTVAVGASAKTFYHDIFGTGAEGAAYVFVRRGTSWPQQQELNAYGSLPYVAPNSYFGTSVALSGDTLVVGAPGWGALPPDHRDNPGPGAIYKFVRGGGTWSQEQLIADYSEGGVEYGGSNFGISVGVNGDVAVVGASNENPGSGVAFVYALASYVLNGFAGNGLSGELLYDPSLGQSYTALSNGDGTFSYVPNLFTANFDTLRTGDFNGDGKADLILYNLRTALAYIGFGKGDGTFNFQSLFWSPDYDIIETGDINGDGKTDVALYTSATGTLYTGISRQCDSV
jgi:hypothetical protein